MIVAADDIRTFESSRPSRSPRLVLNRDVIDSLWIAIVLTGGSYLLATAAG